MASSDHFTIKVKGKRSHAAYPHEGVDAVVVGSEIVTALQTVRSRSIDPVEPIVLSIGIFRAGERYNILADEALLDGTFRTLNETVREKVRARLEQIVKDVASANGATATISYAKDPAPIVYNDPALVAATLPSLERAVGAANLIVARPQMGAEDFAFYQKVIPGFFFFVGTRNQARGITAMFHTAEFDLDETALTVGARALALAVSDFLARP
jgi:amidohydrolase